MAGIVANVVGKKLLKETARNKFGTEDPYFEEVPATRLTGGPSNKTKKVKKRLPPGLSDNDQMVLNKVKRRAYRLDLSLFNCCGLRFGWGSLIGIIPFAGDVIDALLARMVITTAQKVDGGLPSRVVNQMYMNLVVDFVIGFVPFLGDIADAVYKCNTRNAVLLEKELRKRGQARLNGQQGRIHDPSLPEEYDNDEEEVATRRNGGPPPHYDGAPAQPSRAHTQGGSGRSWFGGNRDRDVERAEMTEPAPPQPPRQKSQKSSRRY